MFLPLLASWCENLLSRRDARRRMAMAGRQRMQRETMREDRISNSFLEGRRVRPVIDDTPPEIRTMQISLMRKASVSRRAALALSLSQSVLELSRRAIAAANPGMSDFELKCRFVELYYGSEVKGRLRRYLEHKRP